MHPKPNMRARLFNCPRCLYVAVAPPDTTLAICGKCGFCEKTNLETGEWSATDKATAIALGVFLGGSLIWILSNL